MKMELQLDPVLVKNFCEENNCKPYQIREVLMSFLKKDTESTNYRNIGSSNFDLDSFLISQSPAGLLTLRANALTNKKRIIESPTEPQQKLD